MEKVKFMSFSENVVVFEGSNVVLVKSNVFMSLEVVKKSSVSLCKCGDTIFENSNGLSFLGPSNKLQLAKSSAIELKLKWKTIKGINFSSSFYSDKFSFYSKFLLSMLKSFLVLSSLFGVCFEFKFLHYKSFGFEFSYLEISFNYSGNNFSIIYSSLIFCFKFLFLSVDVLSFIFPNPVVDKSFSGIKEFDNFTHYNNLSFTKLGSSMEKELGLDGELLLSGPYGEKMTSLEYSVSVLSSEGVKFQVSKFHSLKGVVDKCSVSPVFDESILYSCYSESFCYHKVPYKHVLSFNTGGSMYKSCKTFKKKSS